MKLLHWLNYGALGWKVSVILHSAGFSFSFIFTEYCRLDMYFRIPNVSHRDNSTDLPDMLP